MNSYSIAAGIVLAGLAAGITHVAAITINVPNPSFESPTALFPTPNINSWQKTAKPDWYEEDPVDPVTLWGNRTGVFANPAPNSPDHIANCDGAQAIWLFAVPDVGLFQDYDSVDWNDPSATHDFNATYEVGKSYQLTVGLFGGGAGRNGGMLLGVTLELSLYFRDASSNRVTVASTTVTNSAELFTSNTNLVDFTVNVPAVQATDPWAGQHIGILLLSTVSSNMQGGYWDLDNVRLKAISPPALTSPIWSNNQFHFTLVGEAGRVFEVLATTNVAASAANWFQVATVTNMTGTIPLIDTNANFNQRFYRARQLP